MDELSQDVKSERQWIRMEGRKNELPFVMNSLERSDTNQPQNQI